MDQDPVCGMTVDPQKAAAKVEHAGRTYYFCSVGCARRFEKAPAEYLASPAVDMPASILKAAQPKPGANLLPVIALAAEQDPTAIVPAAANPSAARLQPFLPVPERLHRNARNLARPREMKTIFSAARHPHQRRSSSARSRFVSSSRSWLVRPHSSRGRASSRRPMLASIKP